MQDPAPWPSYAPPGVAAGQPAVVGFFDIEAVENQSTAICTVNLPHYDPQKYPGVSGTAAKACRNSIIKLATGMNNDVNPLNFRSKYSDKEQTTLDPYFQVAPSWSTLSWGREPHITIAPAQFFQILASVCEALDAVKSLTFYTIAPDGTKSRTTLEDTVRRNTLVGLVPNLYQGAQAAAAAAAGSSEGNDFSRLYAKKTALEADLEKKDLELAVSKQESLKLNSEVEELKKRLEAQDAEVAARLQAEEDPVASPPVAEPAASSSGRSEPLPTPKTSKRRRFTRVVDSD